MAEVTDGMLVPWMTYLVTHDEEFVALYSDVIKPDQFTTPEISYLFDESIKFFASYNTVITEEALLVFLEEKPDVVHFDKNIVLKLYEDAPEPSDVMRLVVIDKAANWFKGRMMRNDMNRAVDLLEENRVDDARDLLVEMTSEVAVVGDREYGNAFLKDYEIWLEDISLSYEGAGNSIACGISTMDNIMRGGLRPSQMGVILAGTGKGKSQVLNFFMHTAMKAGKNVVYYSLEMSYQEVAQRLWSGLIDIASNDMTDRMKEVRALVAETSKTSKSKGWGESIIKTYPTGQASISMLSGHLSLLERHYKFKPDLVIVDYADILKATGKFDQRRDEVANIYVGLRGLAVNHNIPVWTASQTNKEGWKKKRIDLDNMSDSWDKAKIADYIFGLTQNDDERLAGEAQMSPLKIRNNSGGGIINCDVDYGRSLFIDRGYAT